MSKQEKPALGWAPCLVNGRTSEKTYLVVAVQATEDGYNAAGLRRLGENEYKWHFWPNANAFNLAEHRLVRNKVYQRGAGQSVCAYDGLITDKEDTGTLLDFLKAQDGLMTAPRNQIFDALAGKFDKVTIDEHNVPKKRQNAQLFPLDGKKAA